MENNIEVPEVNYDSIGCDESNVQPVALQTEKAIDDSLGLQPISIRLQKDLIDNLRGLAQLNGLGYQPLIRQILTRWVDSELKHILNQKIAAERSTTPQFEDAQANSLENRLAA